MTVRTESLNRIVAIAAVAMLPLLLSGCTTRPGQDLDWDSPTINQKHARTTPKPAAKPKARPAYVSTAPRPYCHCDDPQYAQNDKPAWYTPTPRPNPGSDEPRVSYGEANFAWPVHGGRVIDEYGSSASGQRNDGINIAVAEGSPIYAAGDGTVSYSGDFRNFGNLALLRHDNGYVTAYAHADHFVVAKGDRVVRGQLIGYVGATGDVSRPQLHFELRKGARGETPVNPRRFLGEQQLASRY